MAEKDEANRVEKKRTCFVVCPLGGSDSPTRNRSDMVLRFIIEAVLGQPPFDYHIDRADNIPDPGNIGDQIINSTVGADLVVADLTDHNPNAFYELGLRHMRALPTIHMIQQGQKIPFDNFDYRTIFYSIDSPQGIDAACVELRKAAEAVQCEGFEVSNPVTRAMGKQDLSLHGDSRDKMIADLSDQVRLLGQRLDLIDGPRQAKPWSNEARQEFIKAQIRKQFEADAGAANSKEAAQPSMTRREFKRFLEAMGGKPEGDSE